MRAVPTKRLIGGGPGAWNEVVRPSRMDEVGLGAERSERPCREVGQCEAWIGAMLVFFCSVISTGTEEKGLFVRLYHR